MFNEFHAVDLYQGHKVFEDIPKSVRFDVIRKLLGILPGMQFPFIYSAVRKEVLASKAVGGIDPVDMAFRMCILAVDQWIAQQNRQQLGLLIMDETTNTTLKKMLRASFRGLRGKVRPPYFGRNTRIKYLHDDM